MFNVCSKLQVKLYKPAVTALASVMGLGVFWNFPVAHFLVPSRPTWSYIQLSILDILDLLRNKVVLSMFLRQNMACTVVALH